MKGIDRISQLPEPILEHILSFLVIKDAAKTSTLSKVWNNAWTSLSCLDFGNECLHRLDDIVCPILESRQTQKISIQRFRLMLWYHHSTSEYVEDMINLLVACNIKELFLVINLPLRGFNKLPETIFAAKALNVLSLHGFELKLPSGGMKFSSLRELHLHESLLDNQFIQALCSSCNDLEVLSLRWFRGLTSLQVRGTLPKLRMVKLEYCPIQFHDVNIVAPNLRDLRIISFHPGINVNNLTACRTLKRLYLHGAAVNDEWVEQLFSSLPNIESIYLVSCASLKTMKISSDRLKHLEILYCNNLTLVDLSTPNLLRFSCHVRYGNERFSTFKLNALQLLEAVLHVIPETVDTNWYSKLIESLGNFNHSRIIELKCYHDKEIVIPKDMRKNLLPPLHGTKRMHVNTSTLLNVDVLDSMLWISPQLDTLSFGCTRDLKTLMVICLSFKGRLYSMYEKVSGHWCKNYHVFMQGGGRSTDRAALGQDLATGCVRWKDFHDSDAADEDVKPCCASLSLKCWRHTLEKVILQNVTCEELQDLRSYFFKEVDILEIIEVPPEGSI